jgi:hypothetical protein
MALKASLTKAEYDALAKDLQAAYAQKGDSFVLDVEGLSPASEVHELKTKLAEFRDNNVRLMKQVADLEPLVTKFKDIDPDEFRKLKANAEKLEKKGVKDPDAVEEMIRRATEAALKPISEKLEAAEKATALATAEAHRSKFRELVTAEANRAKVLPTSLRHVLRDAEDSFDVEASGKAGRLIPKEGVKNPIDPLKELDGPAWLTGLAKEEANLFSPSHGADTNPQNGSSTRVAKTTLVNPTPDQLGANMDAIIKGDVAVVRQ